MKTIVIADIHLKYEWINSWLEKTPHDQVVFLGDYFDDFNDTRDMIEGTAHWLKDSLYKKNRIHLLGNHDLWYSTNQLQCGITCSGNSPYKHSIINDIIDPDEWAKIQLCHWDGKFLYSHAGCHEYWFSHPVHGVSLEYIKDKCDEAREHLRSGVVDGIFSAGWARGAYTRNPGGILWLDFRQEFKPIHGINQVVGHSPYCKSPLDKNYVKYLPNKKNATSINYCVDFRNNYLTIIEDGKVSFEKTPIYKER